MFTPWRVTPATAAARKATPPAEFYLYLNREANEEIATMKRLADATVSSKPLA